MIIYLDIVFLENICMNFIILLATGYILKNNIKYIRILIASLFGSIYVVVSYVTNFHTLLSIPMKILLSIAMIYISFDTIYIRKKVKEILVFYLTSFAFGGAAIAMIYFLKPQNIMIRNGIYIGNYDLNIVLIGGIVGFFLINIVFKIVKNKIKKEDMKCKIIIYFNNKNIEISTMIDTGNMLKDPISKKDVVIVEKEKITEIIPKKIIDSIEKILNGEIIALDNEANKYIHLFKLIPFSSIGKKHRTNFSV